MSWSVRLELRRSTGFTLDVELDQPLDGFTVLFGPSGCGKTTLLRSIAGLEQQARGRVVLEGRVLQDQENGTWLPPHRRRLGMVFQSGALFPHLSVAGNLDFAGKATAGARDEVIAMLELAPLLERSVDNLSGGERQRVALGRALLADPNGLLLDEPLASLDRPGRRAIYPFLDRLHRQFARPTLHVTHELEEAARLGDHLVLMAGGRVTARGPLQQVLTDETAGLATGTEACAVLPARVLAGPDRDGLLRLEGPGCDLWSPARPEVETGRQVRLLVRARDVSLALSPARDSSILNVVPAVVDAIWGDGPARVIVRLAAGEQRLLAAVTRRSLEALQLEAGKGVFAQVKSVALL